LANTPSAIKRMKQSEKRRTRNRAVRSKVRSTIKSARASLQGAAAGEARTSVLAAIRTLDKAVTKGVVHRNTAARKKSALARKLARMV
jgi:small subunit ribosomal protein S20